METTIAILNFVLFIILIVGLIKPDKILKWDSKPTRLKVFLYWLGIVCVVLLPLRNFTSSDKKPEIDTKSNKEETDNKEIDISSKLKQIEVTYEEQDLNDDKQKIVVWVKNNSNYIINGNLSVKIKAESSDKIFGSEYITIENLNPTQKTYSIIWVKPITSTSSMQYDWSNVEFIQDKTIAKLLTNSPYKFLKEKMENGNKLEFYLAKDKDFKKMYDFIISREVNEGVFYHAVFVDNEKYAAFSKYPISAMTFEDDQSKHIVAIYEYNSQNKYKDFSYYEKNSYESTPQKINK